MLLIIFDSSDGGIISCIAALVLNNTNPDDSSMEGKRPKKLPIHKIKKIYFTNYKSIINYIKKCIN